MSRRLVKSSKYSPGNMDQESLENLFVGRENLLTGVIDKLEASAMCDEKHFILVVGARGTGKTHFAALVHERLQSDERYAEARSRMLLIRLNEEEWGIASYLDLLLRILQLLPDDDGRAPADLDAVYEEYERSYERAVDHAETALLSTIGERTLVLLCENLEDIFEGIEKEGQQRFRALIQRDGRWSILATTPQLFAGVSLQTSPFYGFFTVRALELLDFEGAVELLQRKALHGGLSELSQFLATPTGRARVRAVHHLAGGNHRAYVVLFEFLTHESLDQLVGPFLDMVDDLTPYYQDRVRKLPPAQRKLIEFLCRNAVPVPVKEIARRCLMTSQTAAKQLGELSKAGFVTKTPRGRESFYELTEPLLRICFEVKDNRTECLELFVDFLRHWYSGRELDERYQATLGSLAERPGDFSSLHLAAALKNRDWHDDEPFLNALNVEAQRCFDTDDFPGLLEATARFLAEGDNPWMHWALLHALREMGDISKAVAAGASAVQKYPEHLVIRREYGLALFISDEPESALEQIDVAITLEPENVASLYFRGVLLHSLGRYNGVLENEAKILRIDPKHFESHVRIANALLEMGRLNDAEHEVRKQLEQDTDNILALSVLGEVLYKSRRFAEASAVWVSLLRLEPDDPDSLCSLGHARASANQFEKALDAFGRALKVAPDQGAARAGVASCLLLLERYDEALVESGRVLSDVPESSLALYVRSHALFELDRASEAIATLKRMRDSSERDGSYLLFAAHLLERVGALDDAVDFVTESLTVDPENPESWLYKATLEIIGKHSAAAKTSLQKAKGSGANGLFCDLLESRRLFGSGDVARGADVLGTVVHDPQFESVREKLPPQLAAIMKDLCGLLGPVGMASQVSTLRTAVAPEMSRRVFGQALTLFLHEIVEGQELSRPEWQRAIIVLDGELGDLVQCRIPLKLLSVANGYAISGDASAFLELPREQRAILEELLPGPNAAED